MTAAPSEHDDAEVKVGMLLAEAGSCLEAARSEMVNENPERLKELVGHVIDDCRYIVAIADGEDWTKT